MPRVVELDLETYSETPIQHGTYIYAANAEIMLVAWAEDEGEVIVEEHVSDAFRQAVREAELIVIHNSMFDRNVLREAAGIDIPVEKIHDTMVQALSHGLPGSLAKLCEILKLSDEVSKLKDGDKLVKFFCKPQAKNRKLHRATKHTHPQEWLELKRYAKHDILAMRAVRHSIPRWNYWNPGVREANQPKPENLLWEIDQKINDRGFQVDVELAEKAAEAVRKEERELDKKMRHMTGGDVEKTGQRDRILDFLESNYNVMLPDMRAGTLERALADPDLPEAAKEVIRVRAVGALASTAKFNSMRRAVSADGRLRGGLQFCGASRTGRWAGRTFQPQNLPRPLPEHKDLIDAAILSIKEGTYGWLFDEIKPLASSALRGLLVAAPGHMLYCADLSNVEGRVAAWLAGEEWRLDAFRAQDKGTGHDMYKLSYAKAFNITVKEVTGEQRQTGKVQELALQFGGSLGAYKSMSETLKVSIPSDAKVKQIVDAWRKGNPNIVSMWWEMEDAAISAVANPGKWFAARRILFKVSGNWLRMLLPSGRQVCYCAPKLVMGKFGRHQVSYMGVNSYTRKFERIRTYGGKFFENAVQSVARDAFAFGTMEAHRDGYPIVLTVHDENIAEVPIASPLTLKGLIAAMERVPEWAEGLPLAAAGFETDRYKKAD